MHYLRIATLGFPLLLLACATNTPGDLGTVHATGSSGGTAFTGLNNALAEVATGSKGAALDVVLTANERCSDVSDGPSKNAVFLELVLYSIASGSTTSTAPTAPATFTTDVTGPGPYVEADVLAFDATCGSSSAAHAVDGTVTVTGLAGDVVTGTFNLTGPGAADHVTGSFTTAACPGASELSTGSSTTGCH